MQPPLAFSAIPDTVLRSEHPSPPLAVEHGQVAHREPERARLQTAVAAFLDKDPIASFGVGKRIDSHRESMPPQPWGGYLPRLRRGDPSGKQRQSGGEKQGTDSARCRIR